MKCPNCGAPLRDADRYCAYCGASAPKSAPAGEKQEIHIHYHQEQPVYAPKEKFSRKNRLAALLLCLFLGVFGAHKFYLGKIGVGLVYMFTYGLFGIGWLYDLLVLTFGNPIDKEGRRLAWH